MRRRCLAASLAAGCLVADLATAQVSGTNLLEFQAGNVPFTQPSNRTDLYDRLDLDAAFGAFRGGVRFETDRPDPETPPAVSYGRISQRWAEWADAHSRLRVGNLYTILGRGLLHRSFELPGVILDEPGSRSRYAPARDLDGALADVRVGRLGLRAFSGRSNDGTLSPATPDDGSFRYRQSLAGGQAELALPRGASVGAGYLRATTRGNDRVREFGTGFAAADPLALLGVTEVALPLAFEYAMEAPTLGDWAALRRGRDVPHALYASANVLWREWGASVEWKDYDRFRLGFNDPPYAVREHSAPLHNRNTHLLDAQAEAGLQVELTGPVAPWLSATLNQSRSSGAPGGRRMSFEEQFGELRVAPPADGGWDAALFVSRGHDTFDFITDRHLAGVLANVTLPFALSASAEVEHQRAVRAQFFGPPQSFTDVLASATVQRERWGSAGIVVERTTDPQQLELDEFTLEPKSASRTFVGGTLAASVGERHQLSLFVGERRGGRACNAGTCYEVLPLEGAELRWSTRFP